MSQFEQKYYKHYLTKEKRSPHEELSELNTQKFTWWHKWGVFEYLTLFLLLAILLCLCFRCGGASLGNGLSLNSTAMTLPQPTLLAIVPAVGGGAVLGGSAMGQLPQGEERAGSSESSNVPQPSTSPTDSAELGERFPAKVVPKVATLLQNIGKPVSIEDYLYFAHETQSGYPDFIDPESSRMIVSKKPACFKPDCPVTGISQNDKKAYASWLSKLTHTDYTVYNQKNGFVLDIK